MKISPKQPECDRNAANLNLELAIAWQTPWQPFFLTTCLSVRELFKRILKEWHKFSSWDATSRHNHQSVTSRSTSRWEKLWHINMWDCDNNIESVQLHHTCQHVRLKILVFKRWEIIAQKPHPLELTSDPPQLTSDPPQLTSDPPKLTSDPPQLTSDPPQLSSDPPRLLFCHVWAQISEL